MPRTTPNLGLNVWDLTTDPYVHSELAANWDAIDAAAVRPATAVETLGAIPGSGNFAGRLVMLSAANGGFSAWTMIRYDGSAWRPVGSLEILAAIPSSGNFAGRVVMLSATSGGFPAWSIVRYDGSTWGLVGGWSSINNGAGALNVNGLTTTGDVYISDGNRGFTMKDRTTGTLYRLYFTNGNLQFEAVT